MTRKCARLVALVVFLTISVSFHAAPTVSNRPPAVNEVGYLPAPGSTVTVNPPPIAWMPEKNATTYTLQVSGSDDFWRPVFQRNDLRYVMYTHSNELMPGRYHWRYRFATSGTQELSNWSATRSFTIPATAASVPRPPEAFANVPINHPRMLLRPEHLRTLRASRDQHPDLYKTLLAAADKALSAPLMEEPRPWTGGKWNAPEWRGYLREISGAAQTLDTLAFTYLVSGDERYGQRAREWLMQWAKWDPFGPTSVKINDEQTMPIISVGSRAYSWVYPLLSAQDRAQFCQMMQKRAGDAYRHLRRHPYEQRAYDSHAGRMHQFVGEAGIAFHGEIPEAAEWLDYALTIFYGWYPIWGDEDGGWAEGLHYFTSYNEYATLWFDQMRNVLKLDPMKKPFYANVGDFPLYAAPPGSALNGFGDFSEQKPNVGRGRVAHAYSILKQDPQWKWLAERVGVGEPSGSLRYLRAIAKQPLAAPPRQQLLKIFRKIGWACFNSDLLDPSMNVQVQMRSSPYGNISHSHADQNNIVLGAYGEPLLVNTGIRDYYGSPFCKEWYWATQSHNCVLFDGLGQERIAASKGEIAANGKSGEFTWVMGDASNAYGDSAKLYRRWLAFDGKDTVVVIDEVETTATKLSFMWHGRSEFQVDETNRAFALRGKTACLHGHVVTSQPLTWTQTDEYPLQPSTGKTVPEWHLRVEAQLPPGGKRQQIATIFMVGKAEDRAQITSATLDATSPAPRLAWTQNGRGRELHLASKAAE